MALSVVELLLIHLPLRKGGSRLGLDAFPGESPREGAREPSAGKTLGQSLNLGAGISTPQAQLGKGGACGALLSALRVLLDDA